MKQVFVLKEQKKLSNSVDLFKKINKLKLDYSQENFVVFYLSTSSLLIGKEIVFKGGLNCTLIDPKVIFRKALKKNANSIIIAHNHPSGDLSPSEEDEILYERLIKIGGFLDLKVLDSIIFNKKEYYSMDDGNE